MLKHPWIAYVLPFGLFALVTYLGPLFSLSPALVYPIKTFLVLASLLLVRKAWQEEIRLTFDPVALAVGTVVYLFWVGLDPVYPKPDPQGFNPFEHAQGSVAFGLAGIRLFGAVLVVPVMEEVFWRSFAMRYLISSHFQAVAPGTFTAFSFAAVALAFGLEHHHWLPGILAGVAYGWLLVRTKNLFSPILAHSVTNLFLGIHVLATGTWRFW